MLYLGHLGRPGPHRADRPVHGLPAVRPARGVRRRRAARAERALLGGDARDIALVGDLAAATDRRRQHPHTQTQEHLSRLTPILRGGTVVRLSDGHPLVRHVGALTGPRAHYTAHCADGRPALRDADRALVPTDRGRGRHGRGRAPGARALRTAGALERQRHAAH